MRCPSSAQFGLRAELISVQLKPPRDLLRQQFHQGKATTGYARMLPAGELVVVELGVGARPARHLAVHVDLRLPAMGNRLGVAGAVDDHDVVVDRIGEHERGRVLAGMLGACTRVLETAVGPTSIPR